MSLFIFSALVSLPTVANQILADTAASDRIVTHNKSGLTYSIPIAYRQKIAIMPHVVATSSQSWFGGILHDVNDQFPNMAMDHDQADIMFPDWGLTPEEWGNFKKLRTACVVGVDTMKRFNLHVGQQIMLKGTVYPFNVTLNIVGVMSGKAPPNILYFRRDYLEEAAGRPGFVSNIWVRADKSENVPQLIAAIDEQFANSSAETQSESEAAFIGSFMRQYKMMFTLFEVLGFIVVVTVGLVAANTSAMSIRERRGEIAVMRSMGFPVAGDSLDAAGGVARHRIDRRAAGMRRGIPRAQDFRGPQDGHALDSDASGGAGRNAYSGRHHRIRERMDSGAVRLEDEHRGSIADGGLPTFPRIKIWLFH